MRYAVISDIHGNLPALNAVIDDANKYFIDEYIFIGDYYGDLAYLNEVVNTIKNIKGAHVIKGNKENYLEGLLNSDQTEWYMINSLLFIGIIENLLMIIYSI